MNNMWIYVVSLVCWSGWLATVAKTLTWTVCANFSTKFFCTSHISRVPDQNANGVSQAWYIVEIHQSGRKPSIYKHHWLLPFLPVSVTLALIIIIIIIMIALKGAIPDFAVSSLCHELSPTCTLKWPGCNCVHILYNTLIAYLVPLGMKGQLS